MFRQLFLPLIILIPFQLWSQTSVWDRWDKDVIEELHTAAQTEYLNEEEVKVILFMNMARHDGPLFVETFLQSYIQDNQMERTKFVKSLIRDLNKTSKLHPLVPEKDLTAVAQGHAKKTGASGRVGHQNFNKRFEPLMGNPYNHVGENCSYGFDKAIDIVMSLMIDEGISDMGHRKNILSDQFNSVGVAIRPHKNYRINCVIDFGRQIRSGLNEIPY